MSDNIKKKSNRGGARKGAGRPKKSVQERTISKLSKHSDLAHQCIIDGMRDGEQWAVKMWFDHVVGKPVERQITVTEDVTNKKIVGAWTWVENGEVKYIDGSKAMDIPHIEEEE